MKLLDRIKAWWAQTSFVALKTDRELITKRVDDLTCLYEWPDITLEQSIIWREMESLEERMKEDFGPNDLSITFNKRIGFSTLYGRLKEFDFFFGATGEGTMVAFISDGIKRGIEHGNVWESYGKLRDEIKKQEMGKTLKPPPENA